MHKAYSRHLLVLLTSIIALATTSHAKDWPTYHADAARSSYTTEAIPNQLSLRWVFQSPSPPAPAWPTSARIEFDQVFQPIIAGSTVLFGSSTDNKIYAFDAVSGKQKWEFFTKAPIRLAPAAWQDRVFVTSDDGWLYALSLADGKLLWKHRGGPSDATVIGNERITSKWPARGGAVVLDDIVYFAAGVWPSDGVYLHALDAKTGKPIWSNDKTGQLEMAQPHGGANAESGVSSQGYLLADDKRLIVPAGRSVPAVFNRKDGSLLYYQLAKNQQRGGTRTLITDQVFSNGGCFFDLANGDLKTPFSMGPSAAIPGGLVHSTGRSLTAYKWEDIQKINRKGKTEKVRELVEKRLTRLNTDVLEFIVAGGDAILGSDGMVSAVDYSAMRNAWWSHKVKGKVRGIAAGNGYLVVSTDQGYVYGFDGEEAPANGPVITIPGSQNKKVSPPDSVVAAAKEILKKSTIHEGFCVDLDAGNGELAIELARHSKLTIYAVQPDAKLAAQARSNIEAAGLYGTRITVHQLAPTHTSYPPDFANLIVSSASLKGKTGSAELNKEMKRLQRPYGGTILTGSLGNMIADKRGDLIGAGSWTHYNSNPANTLCSDDRLVKGKLSMHWFRDVDFEIPNRHGNGPAPLSHKGYLVVGGVDGIACLDAYNGRTVWIFSLKDHLRDYDGIHHDVGSAETTSPFCIGDDQVFVKQGDFCLSLDLATGKKQYRFKTPVTQEAKNRNWGYLAYHQGKLYGSVSNQQHNVSPRYKLSKLRTESVMLFAFDAKKGKLLWKREAKHSIRNNAITIAGEKLYYIDRPIVGADKIDNPKRNGRPQKKLPATEIPDGTLYAIHATTGKDVWTTKDKIWGTQLSVSEAHKVLLMNYSGVRHGFFALPSETGGRLAAFDSQSGKRLWDIEAKYRSRPIINDSIIYAQDGTWDLRSGKALPFKLERSYGCGQIASGSNMMLFRSATLGYVDISSSDPKTKNFGGIRLGCYINAIPAGGLVLVPDGSSKCQCSYQMRSWFALRPE
ncbi:MAG: PQQ-binding-like beta-propeller repeat protein [Verrucomicrobiales bacterium]|nr:PQQ-binding-like beta-propeller repeat protein [Verrucomicrobiales bacterium]